MSLVGRWTGQHRPYFASVARSTGIDALADLLTSLGIEIEAGVWTVEDARLLGASSFGDRVIRAPLEPVDRSPDGAVATAAEASAELARLGIEARSCTWVRSGHLGCDAGRGGDGQGHRGRPQDTTVLPDGLVATGNGELVAAAAQLARAREGVPDTSRWLHSP